jgi:isohexenylglutaconyl-CoA hydratase
MNSSTNFQTLRVQRSGAVLHVFLDRPEARNAMSLQMVAELRQVLLDAEGGAGQAHAVRVLVLQGTGGHFCAGADLKDMAAARMRMAQATDAESGDPLAQVNAAFGELCVAYAASPLATVAVLEGTVMGGGLGLACVVDVAIASETASFRLPETSLGMVPAQIAPFLVERLGYSQAKRLAVTGGRLDAAAALQMGLVHGAVGTADLPSALDQVLADILACAPGALAATKSLMRQARLRPPAELVQTAAAIFSQAAQGPEALEGISAFMQKRKPQWATP